jgi:hypothetical protein
VFGSNGPILVSKPAPAKIAWSSFENVGFAKFGCDLAAPVLKPELLYCKERALEIMERSNLVTAA